VRAGKDSVDLGDFLENVSSGGNGASGLIPRNRFRNSAIIGAPLIQRDEANGAGAMRPVFSR